MEYSHSRAPLFLATAVKLTGFANILEGGECAEHSFVFTVEGMV